MYRTSTRHYVDPKVSISHSHSFDEAKRKEDESMTGEMERQVAEGEDGPRDWKERFCCVSLLAYDEEWPGDR